MQRKSKKVVALLSLMILPWCTFGTSSLCAAETVAEKSPVFHYNSQGKMDPFRPFIQKETAKKKSGVALSPLQRYGIEQLKLIGIMAGDKKKVAIVSDPKGKSYVISKGTLIGLNNGRVERILDDQVIVEEKTGEDNRKVKIRRIILNLHRIEAEGKL
jgi:type IV pilus assembly protein PilP